MNYIVMALQVLLIITLISSVIANPTILNLQKQTVASNTSPNDASQQASTVSSQQQISNAPQMMMSASSQQPQQIMAQASNPKPSTLLTLEQQQDLLEQLAQLQRQTQQLLAAQQSLAAVAAAAAVNGPQGQSAAQQSQQQNQPQSQQAPVAPQSTMQMAAPSSTNISFRQQQPQQAAPQQSQSQQAQSTRQQQQQASQPQQTQPSQPQSQPKQENPGLPQGPQINWGKCPELEPSETEKLAKANVITKCLETTPLPANITRESVEQHREQIAACALRSEGWFTPDGGYDFGKAEKEIKNKRLQQDLENQVLNYHSQCKVESEEKYPSTNSSIIAQIQLYQACMDYFISDVCGIEVNDTDSPQF